MANDGYGTRAPLRAAQILASLLTVDGDASGLDADLLDGLQSDAAATASTIPQRDANGRMKAADGVAADDVATKGQVDAAVVGLFDHKGAYDAATNSPDLDTSPSGVKKGDAYTVSVAGTFFTEALEVGDVIIADQDDPTQLSHWTRIQKNVDQATTATKGIVELATDGETSAGVVVQGNDARLANNEKTTNKDTNGGYVGRDGSGNSSIPGVMTADRYSSLAHDEVVSRSYTQADDTAATTVLSFAAADYQSLELSYVLRRGTTQARHGTLVVVHINGSVAVDDKGTDETVGGSPGITWSATISGGNVNVQLAVNNSSTDDIFLTYRGLLLKVYSA